MAYATLEQIAMLLKVTPRWINRLVREQGFPRESHGKYDIIKCVHWRIDDLEKRIQELQGGTLRSSKERKELALAQKAEYQLGLLKKELMKVDDVIVILDKIFTLIKTKLPTNRKNIVPNLLIVKTDKEAEKILEKRDNELLYELSESIENIIRGIGKSDNQDKNIVKPIKTARRRKTK